MSELLSREGRGQTSTLARRPRGDGRTWALAGEASRVRAAGAGDAGKAAAQVSVAICTHNRPEALCDLLHRLAPDLARAGAPVVVVDSASEPEAAAAVRACVQAHAGVRLIRLDAPGVSLARNAALAAISTPWLAYVDDDEIPWDGWGGELAALVERLPADCGACGGDVLPQWPGESPPALGRRWFAYLSLIRQPGEFDQTRAPRFGIGHSVVRVAAVRDAGGFDTRLGRDGATLLSGEEVLLVERMTTAGWRIWHSDRLRVFHTIAPERLARDWALNRAYWEGVSRARIRAQTAPDAGRSGRLILLMRLKILILWGLGAISPQRADFDLRIAFAKGYLREM